MILLWPFCSLMWLWFISSPSSISLVSFSFHPTTSLGPSVPALWANNLIISHITTQTHKHITDSHNLDVFVAHLLHPVKWVKVYAVNYHQIIETKRETVKRFKDDRKWAWVITASVNIGQNTFFFFKQRCMCPRGHFCITSQNLENHGKSLHCFFLMQHNELGCTQSNAEESKNR